jgi:hypothetical protein
MSSSEDAITDDPLPWEQGSLLPDGLGVLPLQWVHPAEPATRVARGAATAAARRGDVSEPFPVPGPDKQGDGMMVVTQSCDLVKSASDLPQIEVARVFETTSQRTIIQAQDFGSARFFRVDHPAGDAAMVLDYGQRALLDKGFLKAVEPDNSLRQAWSEEHCKRLGRWLGQRYSRPAIPDEDYECITRPIRDAWNDLVANDPHSAVSYHREYSEWRYRREEDGSLTLYILSPKANPDETTALEVSDFLTQTLAPVYPGEVRVAVDHRSYHTFTKADELSTEQISMEWASRDEGVEGAALPDVL